MKTNNRNIIYLILISILLPGIIAGEKKVIDLIKAKKPFYTFATAIDVSYYDPIGYYADRMDPAPYLNLKLKVNPKLIDYLLAHLEVGFAVANVKNTKVKYSFFPIGLGASFHIPLSFFTPDLLIGARATGGFYFLNLEGQNYRNFYTKTGASIQYNITENLETEITFDYMYLHDEYGGPKSFNFGIGFTYAFGTPLSEKDIQVLFFSLEEIFPAIYPQYYQKQIGVLKIKNTTKGTIKDISVSLHIKDIMDRKTTHTSNKILKPDQTAIIPIYAFFNQKIKKIASNTYTTGILEIDYIKSDGRKYKKRDLLKLEILSRNAMVWNDIRKLGSFISKNDPAIITFTRKILNAPVDPKYSHFPKELLNAVKLFQAVKELPIKYINDPTSYKNLSTGTVDFIQYPAETLTKKSGDCDDLSVLFATLLESAGIQAAFVTIPGHIFILFEVKNIPDSKKVITYKNKNWLPIETTVLYKGFTYAWLTGYETYQTSVKKKIRTVFESVKEYEPVNVESTLKSNKKNNRSQWKIIKFNI